MFTGNLVFLYNDIRREYGLKFSLCQDRNVPNAANLYFRIYYLKSAIADFTAAAKYMA
jgi:hypothetical protein